jgi:Glycoside hydrolase 97.
LPIG